MSNIILPPGITLPSRIQPIEQPDADAMDDQKGRQLPIPTGWKLLCIVPDVADTFDNSTIVKADAYMKSEEHGTTVLFVLAVGVDAYKDPVKFPNGAWCKAGDFVLVRTYSGTRFKMFGKEMRLINDDQVDAVCEDPRGLSRA